MPERRPSKSNDVRELRARLNLITDDELFDLLGIAKGTGKNRQSAGSLPAHYKCGRGNFYRVDEVEAWLRRRRVTRDVA